MEIFKCSDITTLENKITQPHICIQLHFLASLVAQRLKRLPAMWETWVRSLGGEDTLEKEMATHSSILAWRIPWTEEPGGQQPTGSQRVGHDWATSLSLSHFMRGFPGGASGKNLTANAGHVRDASSIPGSGRSPGGGHSNPLQYSCLENPMEREAWQAADHSVAKTWLK